MRELRLRHNPSLSFVKSRGVRLTLDELIGSLELFIRERMWLPTSACRKYKKKYTAKQRRMEKYLRKAGLVTSKGYFTVNDFV